jgi:DNA-binding transcriptional ArsR family regulator
MNTTLQGEMRLAPTLWRTCRVLANRTRLRMIQHLTAHPDLTVTGMAEAMGLPTPVASVYLRALNARGILRALRDGPRVHYRVTPDPTLPEAAILVAVLHRDLLQGGKVVDRAFHALTGFTHPRRIEIVRALAETPGLARPALWRRTGMSPDALRRHVAKLIRRGYILEEDEQLQLGMPSGHLAPALLRLAIGPAPTSAAATRSGSPGRGRRGRESRSGCSLRR